MSPARHISAFDVVAVAGSQGASPVARRLVGALPADFPAAVVYVQHRVPSPVRALEQLLARRSALPVRCVKDGDPVAPGEVHVAPADAQTLVSPAGVFRLDAGRCAADPLFASVAEAYGPRAIAVVLSGRLADGAAGLRAIKAAGGRGLVQDPATAESVGMPTAAMSTGCYDFVLAPERLARALVALVSVPGAAELLTVRGHPLVAVPAA